METKLVLCDCGWSEHQMIWSYFLDEEDEPFIYVHIHLVGHNNIFQRVWLALRYVFGYPCKYGHWDEILIDEQVALELQEYIDLFLNVKEEQKPYLHPISHSPTLSFRR